MAVTMADITKLRKMSGAGMMDCKKALTESDGDIEKAMEIIRKKGQAIAAKRSDREAAEGCVLAKKDGEFAAIIALKCETDFVAKNEDFIALTQAILDAAVANKCKTLDEVKDLMLGELKKLRDGDFDEKMLEANINNFKLYQMQQLENNDARADMFVQSFVNGSDWADEVTALNRMSKLTKNDIVAFANKYLKDDKIGRAHV